MFHSAAVPRSGHVSSYSNTVKLYGNIKIFNKVFLIFRFFCLMYSNQSEDNLYISVWWGLVSRFFGLCVYRQCVKVKDKLIASYISVWLGLGRMFSDFLELLVYLDGTSDWLNPNWTQVTRSVLNLKDHNHFKVNLNNFFFSL